MGEYNKVDCGWNVGDGMSDWRRQPATPARNAVPHRRCLSRHELPVLAVANGPPIFSGASGTATRGSAEEPEDTA